MNATPKTNLTFPKTFSIGVADHETDYSLTARDIAVEVKVAYRINAEIAGPNGRTLLTGWNEAAAVKVTVFVASPKTEAIALAAVRSMTGEINRTLSLVRETEDFLLPVITGVPIGLRIVGTPAIVNRKRPRALAYVADFVSDVRDAWAARVDAFFASIPTETATA